jgi:lipid-A-disaccharide synthase
MAHGVTLEGIGGPALAALGMDCWFSSDRLAVRGYLEALSRLPDILAIRRVLLARLRASPPDLFLGVDAPDFTLGVARRLRVQGVTTVQLVSPSIWAWRPERIHTIEAAVDHMLCLFPFEPACYRQTRVNAVFVGHPLADLVPLVQDPAQARQALEARGLRLSAARPVLAVLPGSRTSEISLVGPPFLEAATALATDFQPVIPAVSSAVMRQILQLPTWGRAQAAGVQIIGPAESPTIASASTGGESSRPLSHLVLEASTVALVASGTATLEAAMFRRPMVIGYRIPAVSYWWMRRKAVVQRIGLPNLLCEADLVPEYLQDDCTGPHLSTAIRAWIDDPVRMTSVAARFGQLHASLRQGCASQVASFLGERLAEKGLHP